MPLIACGLLSLPTVPYAQACEALRVLACCDVLPCWCQETVAVLSSLTFGSYDLSSHNSCRVVRLATPLPGVVN